MKNQLMSIIWGLTVLFFSCKQEIIDKPSTANEATGKEKNSIGKKLNDPYTVEAMRIALDTILKKGNIRMSEIPVISATHYYVRFLPKSEQELTQLIALNIDLLNVPLDYEINDGTLGYKDPNLPEDSYQWLYSVVPINFNFPGIKTEKLKELFLKL
jgi:hypothetical protein